MQTTRGTSLNGPGASTEPESTVIAGRRRHVGVLFAVAAFVIAADVISKIIVVAKLSGRAPVRLLDGLLTFDYTRNAGAAFSIGTGATYLFGIVAIAVIVVILRTSRRLFSRPWAVVLGLAARRRDRQPDRPAPSLARRAARPRRRLDSAPAFCGVQPGRLGDQHRRGARRPARLDGTPARRFGGPLAADAGAPRDERDDAAARRRPRTRPTREQVRLVSTARVRARHCSCLGSARRPRRRASRRGACPTVRLLAHPCSGVDRAGPGAVRRRRHRSSPTG